MLTIPNGTSEQDAINRIKAARGTAEPEEPTQEPNVVDVSSDTTDEIIEEAEELQEEVAEQPEEIEEVEESEEAEEEWFLDLDGEQYSDPQVREWKSGYMMQSD